jgi:hypothetical protein
VRVFVVKDGLRNGYLANVRLYFICITIILRAEFNKGMHTCKHHWRHPRSPHLDIFLSEMNPVYTIAPFLFIWGSGLRGHKASELWRNQNFYSSTRTSRLSGWLATAAAYCAIESNSSFSRFSSAHLRYGCSKSLTACVISHLLGYYALIIF